MASPRVTLPPDVQEEIIDYLHRELGESGDDPEAIRAQDVQYAGEHEIGERFIHFWHFPWGQDRAWVTVEPMDDSYCLGLSSRDPKAERAYRSRRWWQRLEWLAVWK